MYHEKIGPLKLWQWLAGLAVIALVLRLIVVYNVSLWIDDGATLNSVRMGYGDMIAERFRMGHYPWFFIGFKAWYDLAGESILALRTPSLLACMLALPAVAGLAGRLAGARGALIAAIIFVVHGSLLRHAAELRMYSWLGMFGAFLLLTMLRHLEKPTALRAAAIGLIHLCILQIHISGFLFTAPLFATLAILAKGRGLSRQWWWQMAMAFFIPVLITIPVIAYLKSKVDMGEYEKFDEPPEFQQFFQTIYEITISLGENARGWEYILGYGFPLVCLFTIHHFRKTGPIEQQPLSPTRLGILLFVAAFGAPTIAFLFHLVGVRIFGEPRYYITGTAGVLALAGAAGASIRIAKDWRVLLPTCIFLAAAIASTEKMWYRTRDVLTEHGMALNVIVEEMKREVPPGTLIIISDGRQVPAIALYYFGKDSPYRFLVANRKLKEPELRELFADEIKPDENVAMFLYRELHERVPAVVREDFGPWGEIYESNEDQPRWLYFQREGTGGED